MRVYWSATSDPLDWSIKAHGVIERCRLPKSYEAWDRLWKRTAQRVGAAWKRKRA